MRRRDFIKVIAGSATSWSLAARAQQPPARVIGILASVSPGPYASFMAAIKEGLRDIGYAEGLNVAFEYRWAEGRYERLPGQAADLVRLGVAVIVLVGGGPTVPAAKAATTTIPIVFTMGDDPVKSGAVAALNHPGGNITGISLLSVVTEAKRLQLLHELLPHAADIGVLVNPNNPQASGQSENLQTAAHSLGLRLRVFKASSVGEIDAVFAGLVQAPVAALIVAGDAFFNTCAEQLVTLSAHNAVPTMYAYRDFPAIGGLMSYGPSLASAYRQAGTYAGRILRGEKAADLPVQQVEKFDFVVNLKTAKAFGLAISPNLFAIADEVIE